MSSSPVRRAVRATMQVASAAGLVALFAAQGHAQTPVTKDQPAGPPAGAPGGGRGGMGGQRMMQMLADSLNLSAAQKTKVDSIYSAYQAKMPQFTPGTPPTDEQRQQRQQLNAERTAAIKAVLTPEQATKYDAMMEAMRSRMGGGRPPAGR